MRHVKKSKIESFMNTSLLIQYTSYFRILKKYFKTLNNLCDGSGIILPLERKLSRWIDHMTKRSILPIVRLIQQLIFDLMEGLERIRFGPRRDIGWVIDMGENVLC
jgi:hypothetical protein